MVTDHLGRPPVDLVTIVTEVAEPGGCPTGAVDLTDDHSGLRP